MLRVLSSENQNGMEKCRKDMEPLLTIEEAGNYLKIGRSTLYSLLRRGELKSLRIGGSRRITIKQLVDFIDKLEVESEATE